MADKGGGKGGKGGNDEEEVGVIMGCWLGFLDCLALLFRGIIACIAGIKQCFRQCCYPIKEAWIECWDSFYLKFNPAHKTIPYTNVPSFAYGTYTSMSKV